jgi:hypothetical protein
MHWTRFLFFTFLHCFSTSVHLQELLPSFFTSYILLIWTETWILGCDVGVFTVLFIRFIDVPYIPL